MVGNDVVDLRDREAAAATQSRRFDERVFCVEELATLEDARDRRWKLWAAKEAAFKIAVKQDPATVFSPSRFRVRLEAEAELGVVTWEAGAVPVRIGIEAGAVHAVATTTSNFLVTGLERLDARVRSGPEAKILSEAVRSLAVGRLAVVFGVDEAAIEIRKQGRIPEIFVADVRAPADLSLSHHGGVVGFACEIREARRAEVGVGSLSLEIAR